MWECIGQPIITPGTLFPEEPLPVFASWVSGILRCAQGDVVDHVGMGYASTYQNECLIELVDGVVIGEQLCFDIGATRR